MSPQNLHVNPSRPRSISELVACLKKDRLGTSERQALQALCKTAVNKVFTIENIPELAWEASQLAEVLPQTEFAVLLRTLANSISTGTEDQTSLDPFHLRCLAYVIRRGEGKFSSRNSPLGSLLSALKRRIDSACQQREPQMQYELVCTLGYVLDALADIGITNLSRESLHQPVLGLLKELKRDKELHLAQAAAYARQALLGLSDDDTMLEASLRGTLRVVDITMMTLGGVSNHDIHKLYEAGRAAARAARDFKDYTKDALKARRGKHWYAALRVTDVLLHTRSIDKLVEFVKTETCNDPHKYFLCGLYAQLECGQEFLTPDEFRSVYEAIPFSKNDRVRAWAQYLAKEHGNLQPPDQNGKKQAGSHLGRHETEKSDYKWSLDHFSRKVTRNEDSKVMDSELMDQAYEKCDAARRFYTRNALLQHYLEDNHERLNIQRVSGDLLPMDKCYINLAIVDRGKNDRKVALPTLFDVQNMIQPRKIFIEGQAGVGKTTLCKKIVHDYVHHGLWQDRFEWLIWIPLRTLRGDTNRSYSLEDFFRDEYFSPLYRKQDLFPETLREMVENRGSDVLFVLDGLDEISRDLPANDSRSRFIYRLLKQPQVIATSRPYYLDWLGKMRPDLEVKTVGFYPDQIRSYVYAPQIVRDHETATQIWTSIQVNLRLRSIVQVPVLLDALCYCWDQSFSKVSIMTMTDIYESMTAQLLTQDYARYKGMHQHKQLDDVGVIDDLMPGEINILEGLAFHGVLNDIFEFDIDFRNQVFWHLRDQPIEVPESIDQTLKRLSFLRSSDGNEILEKQKFHFLHRTVQEYFAARFFVKHWITMDNLSCLILHQEESKKYYVSLRELAKHGKYTSWYDIEHVSPREFLQDGKYRIQYDMIWRFVTGLLRKHWRRTNTREKPLFNFFRALEMGPRDLLGPAHASLTIDCLGEIIDTNMPAGFHVYRERIEKQLHRWAVMEGEFGYRFDKYLLAKPDFPEHCLYRLLQDYPDIMGDDIMVLSQRKLNMSDKCVDLIASWIEKNVAGNDKIAFNFRMHCLEFLFSKAELLSPQAACALSRWIRKDDAWAKDFLLGASYFHYTLPETVLAAVIERLRDGDVDARVQAAKILAKHGNSNPNMLEYVKEALNDEATRVKLAALEGLQHFSDLTPDIIDSLVQLLSSTDREVRETASFRLKDQPSLTPEIVQSIFELFLKQSGDAKRTAAFAFGGQIQLPLDILKALVQQLGQDEATQGIIPDVLVHDLPPEIMDALLNQLEDEQDGVRRWTVKALGEQKDLPLSSLNKLVTRLQDRNKDIRRGTVETLGRQPAWTSQFIPLLVERLINDGACRYPVSMALRRVDLSQDTLDQICRFLGNAPGDFEKSYIIDILGRQSLQRHHLEFLATYLNKHVPNSNACSSIMRVFGSQRHLPDSVLDVLRPGLGRTEPRQAITLEALGGQSDLPTDMLIRVVECLGEENFRDAANLLRRQNTLPLQIFPHIAEAITRQVMGLNEDAVTAAVTALCEQGDLVEPTFDLVCSVCPCTEDWGPAFEALVEAMKTDKTFYLKFLRMSVPDDVLHSFVRLSLNHRWALYYRHGRFVLELPEGRKQIFLRSRDCGRLWLLFRLYHLDILYRQGVLEAVRWAGHGLDLLCGINSQVALPLLNGPSMCYGLFTLLVILACWPSWCFWLLSWQCRSEAGRRKNMAVVLDCST
ncbi:hypothetical protein BDV59DRAFT_106978 [Aspergillus ambiguus]|uniref:uncharacterized protein n=1 Tax=Aspergillus ambiguus TaxID=176160 RepID=UPI003CCD87CF